MSRCLVWFVAYSMLGWIYESIYCTIQERRWDNRGFLYGPLCPIYGVGIVAMLIVWQQVEAHGIEVHPWQVFLAAAAGSAVLEYMTSLTLERLFHARWWDYSDMPLNLNGRICLPATIVFGLAGLLVTYVLYQPTIELTDAVPATIIEALSLVLTALVAVDATLTISALTQFAQIAANVSDNVNDHMETFVKDVQARGSEAVTQLQETRPVRAVAGAVESVREAGSMAAGQLRERGTMATDMLADERERFASRARATELRKMSASVRAAASRVRRIVPQGLDSSARDEQLSRLRDELTHHAGSSRQS